MQENYSYHFGSTKNLRRPMARIAKPTSNYRARSKKLNASNHAETFAGSQPISRSFKVRSSPP